MKKVKIAILGLGNVGKGVWKIFKENKKEITLRSGYDIEIAKILVRDKTRYRGIEVPDEIITDDFNDVLKDKEIEIVVELMGGAEPAKSYMLEAMKAGRHVVTANKLVLANWGEELYETASKNKVHLCFEASVAGGIPVIREIKESLTADRIEEIVGILNGTTNYILSKMDMEKASYEDALKQAQQKGYAEADPVSDVEGYDTAYKLAIMSSLAFGVSIHPENIYREGINNITVRDIDYARRSGYKIKLLAIARQDDKKIELRVHPAMVPSNHPIAGVNDSFNAIFIKGNAVGDLMFYGRGAGELPTGSAVAADIISILRNREAPLDSFENMYLETKKIKKPEENEPEFYIRFNLNNKDGVLNKISNIFNKNNIAISSVELDNSDENDSSAAFITKKAVEKNLKNSLDEIGKIGNVNKIESVMRIENFIN